MWFSAAEPIGTRSAVTQHPALLFIANGKERFVFALTDNSRPTADTQLYQAPYFNVSNSGWICTGNVDVTSNPNAADIEHYETNEFFRSRFTHPNAAKLIKGGSATALWAQLLDGAEFPTKHLIRSNLSVAAANQRQPASPHSRSQVPPGPHVSGQFLLACISSEDNLGRQLHHKWHP